MTGARVAVAALVGLVVGSFLTVVVERVPRGESVVRPRSRCPGCGATIRPRDNIPILSWVLLRGRCRSCGERIPIRYPLTELGTVLLLVGAVVVHERVFTAALIGGFLAVLWAVSLIDARLHIIPNRIIYPALIVFLVAVIAGDLADQGVDAIDGLVGLVGYAAPLLLIAFVAPGGMGMGDVKLVALIGLVLGSLGLRLVVVAAGLGILSGGLGAVVAVVVLRYGRRQHIPFGPFLAGGAAIAALVGPQIADAYLSMTGLG